VSRCPRRGSTSCAPASLSRLAVAAEQWIDMGSEDDSCGFKDDESSAAEHMRLYLYL
jgi:hypothetical protein